MNQSSIFLTQTYLDLTSLIPSLAVNILQQIDNNSQFKLPKTLEKIDAESKIWQTYLSSERVIIPNWIAKEDFREDLAGLYKHYPAPTLLFLGDLGNISLPAQEGLLKLIEETPPNLHPILFSPDIFTILPTIKSRCQIYNLSLETCFSFLDSSLIEVCKKKYPDVGEFTRNFLNNKVGDLTVLAKAERNEISFWLWQVLQNLESIYSQKPSKNLALKISKVLQAQKLNSENLQKKFALGVLEG
jgi:DNA polymerase III delta prime subunit